MDTTLSMERINNALDKRFANLIDLSDLRPETPDYDRRSCRLSRSLAALAVVALSEADDQEACESITDGFNDLGLDAIYFEAAENTLYVVTSKWRGDGRKTIELGDCNNFLEGVDALIHADFSRANNRLQGRQAEIQDILLRQEVRIALVLVHTGSSPLGSQVMDSLNKFLARQNNVGDLDVFTLEVFDLQRVYQHLSPDARHTINLDIGLSEWGQVHDPYEAFYGQMKLSDVAEWAAHGKTLFDRNLRFYRGSTEVNDAMERTISDASERFWYFNNGITILCQSVKKALLNGVDRAWGVFRCNGVSVVNWAQTVGAIWEGIRLNPGLQTTTNGKVQVRIISLEGGIAPLNVEIGEAALPALSR
jgi:hypothetical protein